MADFSELLNPETVTGLIVLHSERRVVPRDAEQDLIYYQDFGDLYGSLHHTHLSPDE